MDIQDAESLKCQERCAKKQNSWLVFLSECQLYMGAESDDSVCKRRRQWFGLHKYVKLFLLFMIMRYIFIFHEEKTIQLSVKRKKVLLIKIRVRAVVPWKMRIRGGLNRRKTFFFRLFGRIVLAEIFCHNGCVLLFSLSHMPEQCFMDEV